MTINITDRERFHRHELSFEPFQNSSQVRGFHSGDDDLDDFLNTFEVSEYSRLKLGETTLIYIEGSLVGYFTLNSEIFKVEYIEFQKHFHQQNIVHLDSYPAVKIGRFAVRSDLKGKGIGSLIIEYILAKSLIWPSGAQYVVVNSTEQAIKFYSKSGFKLSKHHANPHLHQRVMFYDLNSLASIVNEQ